MSFTVTAAPAPPPQPELPKAPAPLQKPTLGRIVLFTGREQGIQCPAIVVAVFDDNTINVKILVNGPQGSEDWFQKVPYDAAGKTLTSWMWPPRT